MQLSPIDDPIDLSRIAAAICESSNFRFAWQFYDCIGNELNSVDTARSALESIIAERTLHKFLRSSHEVEFQEPFRIEPLHTHAIVESADECFLDIIVRASLDRLGAYSQQLTPSTTAERETVHELFSAVGKYHAFTTRPGSVPDCKTCSQHNNDLFCNWFYDVAWDYTFVLMWPTTSLLWLGCLSDTD